MLYFLTSINKWIDSILKECALTKFILSIYQKILKLYNIRFKTFSKYIKINEYF